MAYALFFFAWLVSSAQAGDLLDATGVKIESAGEPARIVTLAPSLGELAADLNTEHLERIVGVSEYTDFPPVLKKVESVGQYNRFNLEKVVALKPDVVLATKDGNAEDQIKHLRELKLRVVVVDTAALSGIPVSIRQVGAALGRVAAGEKLAQAFEKNLAALKKKAQGRAAKKVLLQLGDEPLIVAGRETFLSEGLEVLGAGNAYADSSGRYPRPTTEDAVARDPDAIVILAMGDDLSPFKKMADHWATFKKMKAVQGGRVRILRADELLRPTMRFLQGLKLLEQAVHGP